MSSPPERLAHLRVELVGYRQVDHGIAEPRVDVVDKRDGVETLLSLSPLDALAFAGQLRAVAGRSNRQQDTA